MEKLGIKQFGDIYRGKRVLVTGHTGFKGSWLTLWLEGLGAKLAGISLQSNTNTNHWNQIRIDIDDYRNDIRDASALNKLIKLIQPEIVFHLAAQPLVRRSYRDPYETWSTNVMGTVNVLEACRSAKCVKAVVVVTTDKCYENKEWPWGYRENDRLGGRDPYSASKAAAELVAASYRDSFFHSDSSPAIATARAGNVIGGGDWSEDRLIPDLVHAIEIRQPLEIRSPKATRPWQHVLESLSGYLLLGKGLIESREKYACSWNFGPVAEDNISVQEIVNKLNLKWHGLQWKCANSQIEHEANALFLDSAKAYKILRWKPIWSIDQALEKTADWYQAWFLSRDVISKQQLIEYIKSAQEKNIEWLGK